MSKQYPYHATIPSIPEGVPRPLWSVMIPTYNCADYLRETLASVLAQDLGPELMQIQVVDDHSTKDDPAAVVEELGHGRVSFYRQSENVGHTRNFQTCLERSQGQLIHLLHGDDCVRDGFYRKMQGAFNKKPEIGAAFCRHIFMDEHSHWQFISELLQAESGFLRNWLERIVVKQYIQTPSIVVRRDVYESLGGFDHCYYYEDWEMWVRIATRYSVWYEVEPLAIYRLHSSSNSGRIIRTGENMRDLHRIVSLIKHYLPEESANKLSKKALEHWAFYALNHARICIVAGEIHAAMTQMKEALRFYPSLKVVYSSLKLTMQAFHHMLVSGLRYTQRPSL